jgi:hypothetical protein
LKEASRDAELRESVFREAAEGVGSCTDRSAITLNRMEELVLQHKAARGDLSQTDLLEAGRGVYRLSRVRYHAQEALKGSHDLITTMLSIEIALRDKLNLPGKTLFIDAEQYLASKSQITSILNLVLADERAANGANLRNFLADWEPWRNNVERLKRSEVERVQAPFYEELERLEARTSLPVGDPQYLNQENYLRRLEEISHRREEALKQFYRDELETALEDLPGTS